MTISFHVFLRMKKALDKVRLEYKVDYKAFVKNIQRESEKVLHSF